MRRLKPALEGEQIVPASHRQNRAGVAGDLRLHRLPLCQADNALAARTAAASSGARVRRVSGRALVARVVLRSARHARVCAPEQCRSQHGERRAAPSVSVSVGNVLPRSGWRGRPVSSSIRLAVRCGVGRTGRSRSAMRQGSRRGIRLASDENAASRSPPGLSPAFRLCPWALNGVRHALRESPDFTPARTRAERVQTVNGIVKTLGKSG